MQFCLFLDGLPLPRIRALALDAAPFCILGMCVTSMMLTAGYQGH